MVYSEENGYFKHVKYVLQVGIAGCFSYNVTNFDDFLSQTKRK